MANQHFANLGDVWKHLWLTGVADDLRPGQYIETHAGSALYRLVDDAERALGVQTFLAASGEDDLLRSSPYRQQLAGFVASSEPSYPGSPLLAMMLLGRACRYVFYDTDRASVDDLLATRDRLGLLDKVQVVHGDGLAGTLALLETRAIGQASLVHVDPFDFPAPGPGGVSAQDLVERLAAAAVPTIVWYPLATRQTHSRCSMTSPPQRPKRGPGAPSCTWPGHERIWPAWARAAASCWRASPPADDEASRRRLRRRVQRPGCRHRPAGVGRARVRHFRLIAVTRAARRRCARGPRWRRPPARRRGLCPGATRRVTPSTGAGRRSARTSRPAAGTRSRPPRT